VLVWCVRAWGIKRMRDKLQKVYKVIVPTTRSWWKDWTILGDLQEQVDKVPRRRADQQQVEAQGELRDSHALPAPNDLFAVPCASSQAPAPPHPPVTVTRATEGEAVTQPGDGDSASQGERGARDTDPTHRVSERVGGDRQGPTAEGREGENGLTEVGSEGDSERATGRVAGAGAKAWRAICWECKRGKFKSQQNGMPRCRGPIGEKVGRHWALGHTGPDFCDDPREKN
jgi:hypothetical protein